MAPRKKDQPHIISVGLLEPLCELEPLPEHERVNGKKWRRKWTITPPTKEHAEQLVWRPILCGGADEGEEGRKHYHHIECIPCHCRPSPHYWALKSDAFEIGCGGGRGSGKSESLLAFFMKGDPASPDERVRATYLNHPKYKFLVLRKNADDLRDFFGRAKQFFSHFGGSPTEQPMKITFPSGAYGVFDHLANEKAYEDYQGHEYARIGVEEIGLIPDESLYLKVLMGCRTPDPAMREQAMVTFNPGGPGARWIRDRFVKMRHPDGRPVKRYDSSQVGEVYTEPYSGRTRVFVFSRVEDNPYKMAQGYDKTLDMLKFSNEAQWRRWRHGEFDAIDGQFFESLRRERRPNEPEEALHVVKDGSMALEPWWPRAIGVDWGFSHSSAVVWGCWSPKGQLHAYREMNVKRMGTVELGAEIARKSIKDLEGQPGRHINLYLSHDAFHRDDLAPTEAEQIAKGISEVFGRNSAFVYAPLFDEETLPTSEAVKLIEKRRRETGGRTLITIQRAAKNSIAGWNLIRELLRWWPLHKPGEFSQEKARELLVRSGQAAFRAYMEQFDTAASEVLPKLLVWDCCPSLLDGLDTAIEDPSNSEKVLKQDGDDSIDALQYLVSMFKFREADVPFDVALDERLERLKVDVPGISTGALIRASNQFEHEHNQSPGYLRVPRAAGPTRRAMLNSQSGRVN